MITAALPVPLGCLVGRRAELRQVGELLAGARLVTLTGAGGSGKTRLAIEAAARFTASEGHAAPGHGAAEAAFVDLAPLTDPELLADHLASVFDVRPAPGRGLVAGLVAALQPRPLLLVLDNCEHLVDRCAVLVESLLQGCPALRVLATSREPLGLAGESLWLVPPLSLPPAVPPDSPDEAAPAAPAGTAAHLVDADPCAADAVQLFAVRAREANPAFRLTAGHLPAVVAICRRLDGLPLALELAAARTRVLSVEQIAHRLDDAFRLLTTGGRTSLPRQKTLRGTFDWSHDLLARDQQVLLRRLAVFAGSFSLEAVEGVCAGDGIAADQVLDALSSLVDRSLVALEPDEGAARYRLLETVRQYARERLRTAGEEEATARRHAAWYAELAETLAPECFGGQGPAALMRRLDQEHDNFRLAADWALRSADGGEIALRLGYALHWYWFARGLFQEGWRRLASALVHGCHAAPGLRARAAVAAGSVAVWIGRPEAARPAVAQAVEALRAAGDAFALGYGLAIHGAVSLASDPELAARVLDEAEAVVAPLPSSVLTAFVGYWRGQAAQLRGDLATARAALERSLALGRALGSLPSIGHSLHLLGRLERREGRAERARELLAEALAVHVRSGDRWGIAQALLEIAHVERERGAPHRAARTLAAVLRQAEQAGIAPGDEQAAEAAGLAAALRAELGEADYAAEVERGSRVGALQALELLGELAPAAAPAAAAEPMPPPPHVAAETSPQAPASRADVSAETPARAPVPQTHVSEETPAALLVAPLEVSALGRLRIGRAGQDGTAADAWSSARTRELLVFLLLHPEGASKQEIGLALWPEASASQLRNAFHVALHRLRSALGSTLGPVLGDAEAVEVRAGGYRLHPELAAGFDVPRFEALARRGLAAAAGCGGEALPDLLAALDLYRGELLQGEGAGEWHLERRDALEHRFLQALAAAGELLEAAGRPAEAAAVYRRWIAADDLCELAYRRLMICLDDLGERPEALRVYRRLAAVLERELGVEPEEETRQVHEQIQRAARRSR